MLLLNKKRKKGKKEDDSLPRRERIKVFAKLTTVTVVVTALSISAFAGDVSIPQAPEPVYISIDAKTADKAESVENLKTSKVTPAPKFQYSTEITLKKEHQEFLYEMCRKRGLDYIGALSLMKVESEFTQDAYSQGNYGYFQINRINHGHLSESLGTAIEPFNPYININWGTYMLSDLYSRYESKGLTGKSLTDAVLSSYNKGIGGYNKTGKAVDYIAKYEKNYKLLSEIIK